MVRPFNHIVWCLMLIGCTTSEIGEMRDQTLVMNSIIQAGDTVQTARVFRLDAESGRALPTFGELSLFKGNVEIPMIFEDGVYRTPSGTDQFGFETEGRMVFKSGDAHLEADFKTPPVLNMISSGATTFSVDADAPDALSFTMVWTFLSGYEYVAQLIPADASTEEIPFATSGGLFSSRFSGPFVTNSIALRNSDFNYYGLHTLRITAIDGPYRDIHFYNPVSPTGELNQGISNVDGGFGWVDAVTGFDIELMILP